MFDACNVPSQFTTDEDSADNGGVLSKPKPLQPTIDAIPGLLRSQRRWCTWRYVRKHGERSWQKVPRQIDDKDCAKLADPKSLVNLEEAYGAYLNPRFSAFDGICCFLAKNERICCLDLDSCLFPTGQITPWAAEILEAAQSYVEVSPSRLGIKIFCLGTTPTHINCRKSYRLPRFINVSRDKSAECLVIREGMVTITGGRFTNCPNEIVEAPGLLRLCQKFDAELNQFRPQVTTGGFGPSANSSPTTRLPPRHEYEAAKRLLKCKMPDQENDGSKLLFSLIAFMVEHWSYSDEEIEKTLYAYHQHEPLLMLQRQDAKGTIEQRIAQVRHRFNKH